MDQPAPIRLTVAACTRQRPQMVAALAESWGRMALPDGVAVTCLLVENDTETRLHDLPQRLANGVTLRHVLEPEPGIPFARNRAAIGAVSDRADLLAFVDDDEVVAGDWLLRMIEGYRQSGAMLLGGPLRALRPDSPLTTLQKALFRGVEKRYRRKEVRAARKADLRDTKGVTIVTNNWLADVRLFTEHGLSFDETMRHTGGTDAKFYAETRALGLPTAWVANAIVAEEIPPARLSLRYQFARGRDQAATHMARRLSERPGSVWQAALLIPLRALALIPLVVAVPLTGGSALTDLARSAGAVTGQITSLFGKRSRLYEDVTGG
ncbi:glycosyltransferase family A protein [Palleronia caenipelagi]|uniref:Glycosyltransferase family 2 protein n=1 Tax=Palleronia caenipelagi TaxID=2489174 RepID=A0A547QA81_9RHOB|nr:glycosyltransferase family A protein [Palleronia caenipelagi]TRD23274.1 glycosyltransferase family 2 protein [Palleronia caenipelagi]